MGYIGFRLGLSSELVKLAGVLFGFFVSFRTYQDLGDWVSAQTPLTIEWAAALAMGVLSGGVYLVLTWVCRRLEQVVQINFQDSVNQMGGLLAGWVRAALTVSLFLVILRQFSSPYLDASIEEHSFSGPRVSRLAPKVYDVVFPKVAQAAKSLR
ncbi:MAG: CvpA family protein [Candidatus Omnitrophica bacterium]|nr:CvpA family protein [Candidatus Omnitrophota bacterium]